MVALPRGPDISTTESLRVAPRRLSRSPTPVQVSGLNLSDTGSSSTSVATKPDTAHRSITAFTLRSNSENDITFGGNFRHISRGVADRKRSASETIPIVRRASVRDGGKSSWGNDERRMWSFGWKNESERDPLYGP